MNEVFAEGRDPAIWRSPIRNAWVSASAEKLIEQARREAGTPIRWASWTVHRRYEVDGDRSEHRDHYFEMRRRLIAAAVGALSSQEIPISAVEDALWAICDEYTWALPAHIPELLVPFPEAPQEETIDLFAAETAFALAEITVLLADRLHPLVVERARREVERRVLAPFRDRTWFWESVETNWSAVCAAGVGLAAMHLDAEGLDGILTRCTAAMDALLAGYGDDGICIEGPHYWNYGFGHFAIYAQALRQCTGEDLWEGAHRDKLAAIRRNTANVSLGGRAVAAFSDAHPYGAVAPALAALVESSDPQAAVPRALWGDSGWAHDWGPVSRQFIWARDALDEVPVPEASARWYPDAQWLVSRTAVDGIEVGFAAKAGANDDPHNHNDAGSFLLVVDGEPLLSEIGSGWYDGFYFLPESRYETLAAGSHGHSVPLLAGRPQRAGADARAVVRDVDAAAGRLVVDISSAYPVPELREAVREWTFAGDALRIQDRFLADEPVEIIDRLVSFFPIVLRDAGAVVRGERHALELVWSAGWEPRVREQTFRAHDGSMATVHMLDLVRTTAEGTCVLEARVVTA